MVWLAGVDDVNRDKNSINRDPKHNNDLFQDLKTRVDSLPTSAIALASFATGAVTALCTTMFHVRYGRRLKNGEWITPDLLGRDNWIKGVVTSVGDADNFRLYHTPALGGYTWPFKFRTIPSQSKDLKDQTLHIRLAGVDAPEAAHFGKPAQPYAAESLAWLRETLLGKKVYCRLLRRDQYSRIVAHVHLPPRILPASLFLGRNVSLELLKAGWGTIYEQCQVERSPNLPSSLQTGAEYAKGRKDDYIRIEAEAKSVIKIINSLLLIILNRAKRRGIWKHGKSTESPAEYKRRYAA
ncbi:hypothetical protein K443DRAFT_82346 [Laccaria amethystina LaAM-08-1]|uniref:TNase-like domain-containing protein n=1 Tax=Laccaria amethystina LaAM-08-1 TaxID=1095629 RepID=A0A0C9XAZ4_9AGAR|nr:hypothetical protein K443DRAFT_82346 [Laccaria amethystina LaAM-08-1]